MAKLATKSKDLIEGKVSAMRNEVVSEAYVSILTNTTEHEGLHTNIWSPDFDNGGLVWNQLIVFDNQHQKHF